MRQSRETGRLQEVLEDSDVERYETLKEKLHAGEKSRAKYLYEIKEDNLYLAEYETFEEFCEKEIGGSRRQADRDVNWARVMSIVGPNGPAREAHARPLNSIRDEEVVRAIWSRAKEIAAENESGLTQKIVRKTRSKYLAEQQHREALQKSSGLSEMQSSETRSGDGMPEGELSYGVEIQPQGSSSDSSNDKKLTPSQKSPAVESGSTEAGSRGETSQGTTYTDEDTAGAISEISESFSLESTESSLQGGEPDNDLQVEAPAHAADSIGIDEYNLVDEETALIDWGQLGKGELNRLITETERNERSLSNSSAEDGIADAFWRPIFPSRTSFTGKLPGKPEKSDTDEVEKSETAVIKTEEIGRLSSRRVEAKADRVLVCPGLDLFSPTVPESFIEVVLDSLKGVEVSPVLFTRHLDRARAFALPSEVMLGTDATPNTIDKKVDLLEDIQGPGIRWVLYDVDRTDWENTLSLPAGLDWIVFDPPGGAGVSLTVKQINDLIEEAVRVESSWSFRTSFKTQGASEDL